MPETHALPTPCFRPWQLCRSSTRIWNVLCDVRGIRSRRRLLTRYAEHLAELVPNHCKTRATPSFRRSLETRVLPARGRQGIRSILPLGCVLRASFWCCFGYCRGPRRLLQLPNHPQGFETTSRACFAFMVSPDLAGTSRMHTRCLFSWNRRLQGMQTTARTLQHLPLWKGHKQATLTDHSQRLVRPAARPCPSMAAQRE